jgi:tRNA dimethylallyltransferase
LSGLVYRQVVELLQGVRDERATRDLIVRDNMRYARRQVIWFRKEAGITWFDRAGETEAVKSQAALMARSFVNL